MRHPATVLVPRTLAALLLASGCDAQSAIDAASVIDASSDTGFDTSVGLDVMELDAGSDATVNVDAPETLGRDASLDAAPIPGCAPPAPYTAPSPASVGVPDTGLAVWLRGDLGLSLDSSARVCAIDDLSGAGRTFSQPMPELRPSTGLIGGHGAVAFGAGTAIDQMSVLGMPADSARTIVIVAQLGSTTARATILQQGVRGTPGTYLGTEANTFNTVGSRWGAYLTNNAYDGDVPTSTSPVIHVFAMDTMTPGLPVLPHLSTRLNGVAMPLTRTPGGNGDGNIEDFSSADVTYLGNPAVPGQDFTVAEVLAWSRTLTAAELRSVEGYLGARYAIALP